MRRSFDMSNRFLIDEKVSMFVAIFPLGGRAICALAAAAAAAAATGKTVATSEMALCQRNNQTNKDEQT